jgi:hypothetical protein
MSDERNAQIDTVWSESKCGRRLWALFSSHSQDWESQSVQASMPLFAYRNFIQTPR